MVHHSVFLFSTNQFSNYVKKYHSSLRYFEDTTNDFPRVYPLSKLEEYIDTDIFSYFLSYIIFENKKLKDSFQRFLNYKSFILKINPVIHLDNIEKTCDTFSKQFFLLLSMLYYFV